LLAALFGSHSKRTQKLYYSYCRPAKPAGTGKGESQAVHPRDERGAGVALGEVSPLAERDARLKPAVVLHRANEKAGEHLL
jgi:hypothetical protein